MSEQRGTSKVSRSGGWITRVFLWLFVFLLCVSGAAGYYFGLPFVSNLLAEKEMITESVQALKVENANLAKTIPAQIETVIGSRLTKLTQQQSEEIARLNDEVGRLVSSERRLLTALSRTEAQLTQEGIFEGNIRIWQEESTGIYKSIVAWVEHPELINEVGWKTG